MQVEQIAIFGPGLIGGSIALAARERNCCRRITVWSRDARERAAVAGLELDGGVTGSCEEAVREASLVLLCTPPAAIVEMGESLRAHLRPGAIVSDVASVKTGVVAPLHAAFTDPATGRSRFVGAHPMAGAEHSGLAAARGDLFQGAVCLLTPCPETDPEAVQRVGAFWESLGARVREMTPAAHDETVALLSHLPHVVAAALVSFAGEQPAASLDCAGPGWRDVTRIAAGAPDLWTEILSRNRAPVTNAIEGLITKLREVLDHFGPGQEAKLHEFLAEARERRASLGKGSRGANRKDE